MSFSFLHAAALVCALPALAQDPAAGLAAPDPARRWQAVVELGKGGPGAVPAALRVLAEGAPLGREAAARALGRMGSAACASAPGLARALKDAEAPVRERAAEALGLLGPCAADAAPALAGALGDPDPYVQGQAAVALGRLGRAEALDAPLRSPDAAVRKGAVNALGRMGAGAGPEVPALVKALADPDAQVRYGAALALGEAMARDAAPAVREVLADADEDVRWAAAWTLARLGGGPGPRAEEVLRDLTPALMRELKVPGVSVAVIRDRKIAWSGQFGLSEAPAGAPVTPDTRFEACSMSKPVFAHVALLLVDRHLLDLDRPLCEYLDEPAFPTQEARRAITARMVLDHTSGLPNWRKGDEEQEGPLPVLFRPGSRFSYSGEGMFYLQRVVEKLAGEPLELLAERTLFRPLGMARTSFVWTPALAPHLAAGHKADGAFNTRTRYLHANAAYSLYTTAGDYARFLLAWMDPGAAGTAALSPGTLRACLTPQVALDAREPMERPGAARGLAVAWGLGWSINTTPSGPIYHHSGSNRSGFRCFSQFDPARGTGLVIMTNGAGGGELWTRLVSRMGDLP